MNAGFRRLTDCLGSSYWFVLTVMSIAAVLLAGGMMASLRNLKALGEVSRDRDKPDRLTSIRLHVYRLAELPGEALKNFNLTWARTRTAELRTVLDQPDYKRRLREGAALLAGAALRTA